MKFQPKRFVVEVKRGTSRAAFSSPDPSSDKFSSAEALLFGGAPAPEARPAQPRTEGGDVSGRRILRSLVEPPEPVRADEPAPARRGRKPGSKNKPKPEAAAATELTAERARRGRKPGSKNKPKAPVITAFPTSAAHSSVADVMRSYGFSDEVVAGQSPASSEARAEAPAPLPTPAVAGDAPGEVGDAPREAARGRLRDRSRILKRYVLDLEPRPGHPGALRARRRARAER